MSFVKHTFSYELAGKITIVYLAIVAEDFAKDKKPNFSLIS